MDISEFEVVLVKQEVDCNEFNEVAQTYTAKNAPCKVNVLSECGRYDANLGNETNLVHDNSPTYSSKAQNDNFNANKLNLEYVEHSEVCEDVSNDECDTKQIKIEDNIDIFYEDIKREIGEEKSSDLSKVCDVLNKSFSSETEVIDQKQNDSLDLRGEDVKPSSLILTTDFESQSFLKNNKRSNNAPDDLILPRRKCCSVYAENVVSEKPHTGKKSYFCQICSKSFSKLKYLKAHESSLTAEKPFHCQTCSKTFILDSSNLKIHKRIHTKKKQFYCKICSKYLSSLKVSKDHERIHEGETPFYCEICSETFIMSSSNFKIHERIHTGAKPFHCKICSKHFSSLQYVKIHERVHTDEKQFQHQLKF